jgi:hypothetical protein
MSAPRSIIPACVLTAIAALTTVAMAACPNPVKPDATEQQLRELVSGTWYSENHGQMGMTQRMYQTFSPIGNFEYRDQTCGNSPGLPCSQNYGHGVWMATRQPDGTIYIRVQFNDLKRQNECTGWGAYFPDPNTMGYVNGGGARRVP